MKNPIADAAWRTLRTRVIAHGERIFIETGALETIVDLDVHEIDSRTARIAVTLSSGAVICADFNIWNAAVAQGVGDCFGSRARPN